jgi:hypothetical protein
VVGVGQILVLMLTIPVMSLLLFVLAKLDKQTPASPRDNRGPGPTARVTRGIPGLHQASAGDSPASGRSLAKRGPLPPARG